MPTMLERTEHAPSYPTTYETGNAPDAHVFDWEGYRFVPDTDYAVILNFNGVLIDSGAIDTEAWTWLFQQLGWEVEPPALQRLLTSGLPTPEILRILAFSLDDARPNDPARLLNFGLNWALVKEQRQVLTMLEALASRRTELLRGVDSLLKVFSTRRTPVGLYSMFSGRPVFEILQRVHLKNFFSAIVTPDILTEPVTRSALEHALHGLIGRLGMPASRCFLLEDSPAAIDIAEGIGLSCIEVGPDAHTRSLPGTICGVHRPDDLVTVFQQNQNMAEVKIALAQLRKERPSTPDSSSHPLPVTALPLSTAASAGAV